MLLVRRTASAHHRGRHPRHRVPFGPHAARHQRLRSPRRTGWSRKRTPNLAGEDVREGLAAVISVRSSPEPQFEGQTKTKLGNAETRSASWSRQWSQKDSARYLEENQNDAKRIIEKCIVTRRKRPGGSPPGPGELVLRKNVHGRQRCLPGKLADCTETRPRALRALHRGGGVGRRHRPRCGRATGGSQAILPLQAARS